MKIIQFKNDAGVNVYVPHSTILRIADEGEDKAMITFQNNETQVLNIKSRELIDKIYRDETFALIITDAEMPSVDFGRLMRHG